MHKASKTKVPKDGSFQWFLKSIVLKSASLLWLSIFSGWEGDTCDDNINECDGNPCLNGGMCMDTPGSFLCGCPFGKYTKIVAIHYCHYKVLRPNIM